MSYLVHRDCPLLIPKELKSCTVERYGDLKCPTCGAVAITPDEFIVVPGIGRCQFCLRSFKVTRDVALQSQTLQAETLNHPVPLNGVPQTR